MSEPAFPRLAELQELFWKLITAPEGVARGVAELRRQETLASEDLGFLVRGDGAIGAVEGLDVYADMYFYRLRDCLAEDFPRLTACLGPAAFHNLVTDYLLAHPSAHFSLRELGRALPLFLRSHEPTREQALLAELAALEWARVDVFDERDTEPLSRQELLARAAESEDLSLALVPALRLLRVDGAVPALWKQLGEAAEASPAPAGAAAPVPTGVAAGVCVWRKGFAALHRSLPADEERCLRQLARGPTRLAQLGETLLAEHGETEAPPRLAALLAAWAEDGLLAQPAQGSLR